MMFKKIVSGFMMAVAMLLTVLVVNGTDVAYASDYDAQYTSMGVNKVDDIEDLQDVAGYGVNNTLKDMNEGGKSYYYYYTFTLDQPSYVIFKEYCKAVKYNFNGDVIIHLSSSKTFAEAQIMEKWMQGDSGEYSTVLEAGTYYVRVHCQVHSDTGYILPADGRVLNLGVYAEPITRTGTNKGSTIKTAIDTNNKTASGVLTKTTKNQYFKFTVSTKSDVTLKTVITQPQQWTMPESKVTVYREDGSTYCEMDNIKNSNKTNFSEMTLKGMPKGTYYVCVSRFDDDKFGGVQQFVSIVDRYAPAVAKAKTLKVNATKVTGTGEVGAKVIVKYNGKTYTATVGKSGTFSVKVPKLKKKSKVLIILKDTAGNQSKTTTVTVK